MSAPAPQNPFAPPSGYAAPPPGYGYAPPSGYAAPPPGYGYAPPPGYGYAPPPAWPSPPLPRLAEWGQRALGHVVDSALSFCPMIIALVVVFSTLEPHRDSLDGQHLVWFLPSTAGVAAYLVCGALSTAISVWNLVFRQGRTGQSVGKRLVGIRLVSETTLQPIGPLMAFVRQLAHYADALAMDIGYLWPLWDAKRRTFADMIMKTVVIVAP